MVNDVLSTLLQMRPEDFEAAERQLLEIEQSSIDTDSIPQLKQLRAAAVNAMHLFRSCAPDSEATLYSAAGETKPMASPSGISVTA